MSDEQQPRQPTPDISVLDQRRIEAGVIKPLFEAFAREMGPYRARQVLTGVIKQLAADKGREMREAAGGDTRLTRFAELMEPWTRGGALETEEVARTDDAYHFNVTRCRYAEMYRELGLADLGFYLSCNRDGSLMAGFDPEVEFERTQTLMEGAPCCDFRYTRRKRG